MKINITIIPSDFECVEWTHWRSKQLTNDWNWKYLDHFIATTWETL